MYMCNVIDHRRHHSYIGTTSGGRGVGAMGYAPLEKFSVNFGSLKLNFLHFEGTFEQNIKV